MTDVTLDGYRFRLVEAGKGAPVVLVHGSASDHRTWHHQMQSFAQQHRVIAYSRRYHWPNRPIAGGADYSMKEHVADLEALLDELALGPVPLVGHSYGGYVALLLALRRPDLVACLVLAEPPVVPLVSSMPPGPGDLLRLLVTRPRTAFALIRFGATGVAPATKLARRGDGQRAMLVFGKAVLGKAAYNRLSGERRVQVRDNSIIAEFLGSGFAPLGPACVRRAACPVLVVTGQSSPALFHRLSDRLCALLPHAERVSIPGASHIMHEDNPAAYDAAVLDFLDRQAPLAASATGFRPSRQ